MAKRAELAGQIDSLQTEITRLKNAFVNLGGSIKLFDPDCDLITIKGKRTNQRNQYFKHGEFQRFTVDLLRANGKPMSSPEIVDLFI